MKCHLKNSALVLFWHKVAAEYAKETLSWQRHTRAFLMKMTRHPMYIFLHLNYMIEIVPFISNAACGERHRKEKNMTEKRFTLPGPVLDEKGSPIPGWATSGILQYNRKAIQAPFYRIKEWDWYQVSDDSKALQFTYGHASYAGQVGVMFFDFEKGEPIYTKDIIIPLPFGRMHLEASAEEDGTLEYNKKDMLLRFEKKGDDRYLFCKCPNFEAEVSMTRQNPHALVINVPFKENPKAFYYNHKISCMRTMGRVVTGGKEYVFDANAWGLLDWGRGVWPFHNEWYWSSASGYLGGEVFGFNLGCGFGDTRAATENCVFYKQGIHKLGAVRFELGKNYDDPWRLVDTEGRLDITLHPVYDRETAIKLLWVNNNTHQMFGKFGGYVILDDGSKLDVENITGFAEHAVNNW